MDEEGKELVLYEGMKYKALEELINKELKGRPYEVYNGGLYYITNTGTKKWISNFIMIKVTEIKYIDGYDENETDNNENIKYEIAGILLDRPGKELKRLIKTVAEYERGNFISSWSSDVQYAGNTNSKGSIDKIKDVARTLSRTIIQNKTVFTSSGFHNINGKDVFLYNGGYIGDVDNVCSQLETNELQMYQLTDKIFDITECMILTLGLLDVAKHSITIPLIAITFYSPLYSMLAEEGIPADSVYHVYGQTGSRKSSLTACFLNYCGIKFDKDNFPATFDDTINSIEKKLHIAKDQVFVCDDLSPAKDDHKIKTFEGVLGKIGDRGGRARMRQNGTLRETNDARCMCITTGEIIPDLAESRLARALILEIDPSDVDDEKLAIYQKMINKEKATFTFKEYIQYIIDNKENLIEFAKKIFNELRTKKDKDMHGRIYDSGITIEIGFSIFLKFMNDFNIISIEKKESLEKECHEIVSELLKKQKSIVESEKPEEMFIDAVNTMFAKGDIYVKDYSDGNDINKIAYNSDFVGFYNFDKREFYFFHDTIFGKVRSYYSKANKKFPINARSLWDYLYKRGLLQKTPNGRPVVPKRIQGNTHNVVVITSPDIAISKEKTSGYKSPFAPKDFNDTF